MKVNEVLQNPSLDVRPLQTVYAIKKEKCAFGEIVCYLMVSESGHLMWEDADRYRVVDSEIPSDWIRVQNKKNRTIKSADEFSGDGSVTFVYYMGPPILMDPIDNLVRISNVDAELSKLIIERY